MANMITGCRILCSLFILFVPAFSPLFYFLYCVAGISDMIDGTVARKTNTVSEFGCQLDTIADIVYVIVCMIKIIPFLMIPTWLYLWIGIITIIKVFNMISGYIIQKTFVAKHTIMNKFTGFVLFLLPLTLSLIDFTYSAFFISIIAISDALQEDYLIITK